MTILLPYGIKRVALFGSVGMAQEDIGKIPAAVTHATNALMIPTSFTQGSAVAECLISIAMETA